MIYWDSQDSCNEGWAERIRYTDGHEETGPCISIDDDDPEISDLQEAVVELGIIEGVEFDTERVHVDLHTDPCYAVWYRN